MRGVGCTEPVVIAARFCGPADRGNGGITAGLLAGRVPGAPRGIQVTLRAPSPLETPMTVSHEDGTTVLRAGGSTVAEAVATDLACDAPAPPTLEEARAAASTSPVLRHPDWHPFPSCFVCGPARRAGDGLRVHPGRVAPRALMAAVVEFPADLADAAGLVPTPLLWAALDCPSSFVMYLDGRRPRTAYVLGRIAARFDRCPAVAEPLIACAWPGGVDGRKLFAASALYAGTELVACARATWISV
jgi:hypothetical protein